MARLFLLLLIAAPALATEPPAKGTLTGTVVDPEGHPVGGARVWMDGTDENAAKFRKVLVEANTDADGRFRLGPMEPVYRHRFDVFIDADGFACLSIPPGTVSVIADAENDLGTIAVYRGRVYTGQVIDHDGKAVAGAKVEPTVYRHYLGHTVTEIGPRVTLRTDTQGRFRTPPLPVGRLSLSVWAPERQPAIVSRQIAPGGDEDLGAISLKKDVPIAGVVRDEDGHPVAGARITTVVGHDTESDAVGRFVIRGFEANPELFIHARKEGYAPHTGRLKGSDRGHSYTIIRSDNDYRKPAGSPVNELVITLDRVGWIEGQAVDAETGKPVRLDKLIICNFERKQSGEVVLRGCRSDAFQQPEPGRFRVSFPAPEEYHLTFMAEGYHDAELFTPRVTDLKTITGVVARMKKKTAGSTPDVARQSITGQVTRDGQPVKQGWVALWALRRPAEAANAPIMRGRTVVGDPIPYVSVPVRDGSYVLDVPFQSDAWYVVVEEPGHALTQVGPIAIALRQQKSLDISCVEGGQIRGRVKNVPVGWEVHLWVVAFSKTAVRAEARVNAEGLFLLPLLPPGEYGLKVGHDAFEDPEVYPGKLASEHPEAFRDINDPWKRARVVHVEEGRDADAGELELPQ